MDLSKIKALRELTGMGMLEVKKALEEADDDLEKAQTLLMKQTTKTENTSQRVASKGLTRVKTLNNEAILFEVNAETDFISKHPDFIKLLDDLSEALIISKAITVKDALKVTVGEKTAQDYIVQVAHIVKENIYLRRFHRIKKQDAQVFQTYMHLDGKVSVLVILDKPSEKNRDIALQITSHQPQYLSYDNIDQETINYEKMMFEKQQGIDQQNFETHLKSLCLYDQPFIKNPSQSVKSYLGDVHVIDFYRFELGQGIENKLNCRLDIPCDGSKITVTPIY
jgi:elongation factor Ts